MAPAVIISHENIDQILKRLAAQIIERHPELAQVVLLGIQTRGVPLAARMSTLLKNETGTDVPYGALGVTFYRDDIGLQRRPKVPQKTEIPFDVTDAVVILIDDVLFTGRTIRAAMDEVMDNGRPRSIELLVLVDRGNRELPIAADYIGRTIESSRSDHITAKLKEIDGTDEVILERS